jgi:CHAT domain-containing protein
MLEKQLGSKAINPSHADVVQQLRTPGSFDLLHFACHGEADATQIDEAALLLQGELIQAAEGTYSYNEILSASVVAQFADLRAADGNRPLVVINACQTGRIGYTLSALGGFAPAFLGAREGTGDSRGRAGAFVGALWSVGDFMASTFVKTMYDELRAGHTMSHAAREGRKAARAAGEGTWLAYAVYSHPHLRVTFSP